MELKSDEGKLFMMYLYIWNKHIPNIYLTNEEANKILQFLQSRFQKRTHTHIQGQSGILKLIYI